MLTESSFHHPKPTKCQFCFKSFNRRDNWLQHIKLHTLQDRAAKRTRYYPLALDVYNQEKQRNRSRSQRKRKQPKREDEDCCGTLDGIPAQNAVILTGKQDLERTDYAR